MTLTTHLHLLTASKWASRGRLDGEQIADTYFPSTALSNHHHPPLQNCRGYNASRNVCTELHWTLLVTVPFLNTANENHKQTIMYRGGELRINGVYYLASLELQMNQILQLQCISPALIRAVNTHIFLQVPAYFRYITVVIPKILASVNACGGQSFSQQTNSCSFPLINTGTDANKHWHPHRKVHTLFRRVLYNNNHVSSEFWVWNWKLCNSTDFVIRIIRNFLVFVTYVAFSLPVITLLMSGI